MKPEVHYLLVKQNAGILCETPKQATKYDSFAQIFDLKLRKKARNMMTTCDTLANKYDEMLV